MGISNPLTNVRVPRKSLIPQWHYICKHMARPLLPDHPCSISGTVKIAFGFVNNSDVYHKGGSLKIVFRMS